MNIGASAVGRYFWFTDDCKVVEARILQKNEHPHFWEAVDHCIYKAIDIIATIDTYLTGSRWNPTDSELATYTDWLCRELINSGANKSNCKISWDNEPEEYSTKELYTRRLNLIHKTINGRFDLIAGNVQADLGFIDYVARNGKFEILGVHFQSLATTVEKIEYLGNGYKRIAKENNKRLTCTEANWFDVSTNEGYQMLLKQLIKAEAIGCEDFCVAVIDQTFGYQNSIEDRDDWLAFLVDGVPRNKTIWNDFVRIINEKGDDMKLDKTYQKGSKGIGVRFVQRVLNEDIKPYPLLVVDGIWGVKTDLIVKEYQKRYGLKIDGIVGRETFTNMIKNYPFIWNLTEYEWSIGVR